MKIERSKNASRNILTGIILRIFQTIVPFLLRPAMIYKLGMEYAGLDSLFVSILHVLNLAELGVGSAMVYSMYKPIAVDDKTKLNALLNLYKKYYRVIGAVVLTIGLLLIPFLPKLISGEVPNNINIYALYIINLFATVLSYWLFAYKNSLLMAHQRTDVSNKINLVSFFVRYCLQFIALLQFNSIYLYFMGMLISQLITNVSVNFITNRMFPNFTPSGNLEKDEKDDINKHIRDLFTAKLGGTITNSADTIIISAFLGLTLLAKYNNYYYILSALFGFLAIIFQSCLAGIGNSLIVESPEKNYKDFEKFTMLLTWIIGYCTACIYCLIQPFMKIWVHEVNMLDNSFPILFSLYFYVYELALVWSTYKDAGGIWHKDRFRPMCVTIVNLGLNLLTVKIFGLYGVILSTVISYLVVGMPWMLHNIFNTLFHRSAFGYIIKCILGIVGTVIACAISSAFCAMINIEGVIGFIIKGIIVTIVSNVLFLLLYFRTEEFKSIVVMASKLFYKKQKIR